MSGKRFPIHCPKCDSLLVVRRSSFKTAIHPLYLRRGKIVVNWGKNITTEEKKSKFWLKCANCPFDKAAETEENLLQEIGIILIDFPPKDETPPPQTKKALVKIEKQKPLLTIKRPSKLSGIDN